MSINNHCTSSLSLLDLEMVKSVPPGGNWKDIPDSIPSKRLTQIREGFLTGKGSRSTYYGRMNPDSPSYTLSTYFNRPGNGCFIHYDFDGGQHRLISQREAARLQSFPDDFKFLGSKTSIYKQIGNAVPPLLAFQIAITNNKKGVFIDLFSGAGGLSKGFEWAGWTPLLGNDIDENFLKTYSYNRNCKIIKGDISSPDVYQQLIDLAKNELNNHKDAPFILLGGPPCQGFSTAGKKRSMKDERNHLFKQYAQVLIDLKPDAFIFENVMGLKNMEGGKVLELIKETMKSAGYNIEMILVSAEEYGVPQRRKRVIIHGANQSKPFFKAPEKITRAWKNNIEIKEPNLPKAISIENAISDLPGLEPDQDGSNLDYVKEADNVYLKLMRGEISPMTYINSFKDSSNVKYK